MLLYLLFFSPPSFSLFFHYILLQFILPVASDPIYHHHLLLNPFLTFFSPFLSSSFCTSSSLTFLPNSFLLRNSAFYSSISFSCSSSLIQLLSSFLVYFFLFCFLYASLPLWFHSSFCLLYFIHFYSFSPFSSNLAFSSSLTFYYSCHHSFLQVTFILQTNYFTIVPFLITSLTFSFSLSHTVFLSFLLS